MAVREVMRLSQYILAALRSLPALSACLRPRSVKLPCWRAMVMIVFPLPRDQARAGGSTDSGTTIPQSAGSVTHGEAFCFANSGRAKGKALMTD